MTKIKVLNRKPFTPEGSPTINGGGDRDRNQTLKHRTFLKPGRNDEYVDSQFQEPPVRIPKKSILLAAFLFIFGSVLLVLATLSILNNDPDTSSNSIVFELNGCLEHSMLKRFVASAIVILPQNLSYKYLLYMDRVVPLLILGTLLFIPGFYHVRIAYLCWMGVAGYNFDDIPEFE